MANQVGPFEGHLEKSISAAIAALMLGAPIWSFAICN
jgi:hypothetical protein